MSAGANVDLSCTLRLAALVFSLLAAGPAPAAGQSLPAASGPPAAAGFVVFDATLYRNKPDLSRYGLRPINVVYGHSLYPDTTEQPGMPDRELVRQSARRAAQLGQPIVLDIEHWPLTGDRLAVAASLRNCAEVTAWFRADAPGASIGFYGMPPLRDYWRAIRGETDPGYREWQAENRQLDAMTPHIDAVYPSLYTFYPDRRGWVAYALANIRQARRYGKPVYVFLWPQYHESSRLLGWRFMPADYWELQLQTASRHADGVVIWGGWTQPDGELNWDETAPWWQVTRRFLAARVGQ